MEVLHTNGPAVGAAHMNIDHREEAAGAAVVGLEKLAKTLSCGHRLMRIAMACCKPTRQRQEEEILKIRKGDRLVDGRSLSLSFDRQNIRWTNGPIVN